MKEPAKVLFISQEITPYLPESEMATISREFPQFIQEKGCAIRTFMPCFGNINKRRNQLHEVQRLSGMNLIIDDTDHPLIIKVASIQSARMQVYFIDNDDYFIRKGTVCDENGEEWPDNDDRMIFFARGVLETIKKLRWTPDIIHCHGWFSALAPLYIKKAYHDDPFFRDAKVVFSIFDNDFKATFDKEFVNKMVTKNVEEADIAALRNAEKLDCETILKFAVDYSDAIIAASPKINEKVVDYISQKGVPYLPYCENNKEDYLNFYSNIFPAIGE